VLHRKINNHYRKLKYRFSSKIFTIASVSLNEKGKNFVFLEEHTKGLNYNFELAMPLTNGRSLEIMITVSLMHEENDYNC